MVEQVELFPGNKIERELRTINASEDRHDRFIEAWITNGMNGTEAAIAAGYSAKTARAQASRLLTNADIQKKIAARVAEEMADLDISVGRTLQEVGRVATFDFRKLFRPDGTRKDVWEIDENTARAISSFELDENGKIIKVKFVEKGAALDKLMRYHSLYEDKLELKGKLTLEALVAGYAAE